MSFKSENIKKGFKSYIILVLLLIAYILVGSYGLKLFPIGISPFIVGSGILIATVFLIYYLKMLNDL